MTKRGSAAKKTAVVQLPTEPSPVPSASKAKDIGHDPIEEHKHKKHTGLKIAGIILLVCILAVAAVLGYILSKAPIEAPARPAPLTASPQIEVIAPPPMKPEISIAWALNNTSIINGNEITLRGYLRLTKNDDQNRFAYFIVDDKDSSISLRGLSSSDLKYFSTEEPDLYTIRGYVRKYQSTYQIDVKEIKP